jgi:hypothetical protein
VTGALDMARLRRSFAGVESSFLWDLGHREPAAAREPSPREPGRSRVRPPTAGLQARRAADRLDGAFRRVGAGRPGESRRLARR